MPEDDNWYEMQLILACFLPDALRGRKLVLCIKDKTAALHSMTFNSHTRRSVYVIEHARGTMLLFTGEYDNSYKERTSAVAANAELYRSDDKFDAGCGWPAFDQKFEARRQTYTGCRRSPYRNQCANCNTHLGMHLKASI